jgi:hypothetical protein
MNACNRLFGKRFPVQQCCGLWNPASQSSQCPQEDSSGTLGHQALAANVGTISLNLNNLTLHRTPQNKNIAADVSTVLAFDRNRV